MIFSCIIPFISHCEQYSCVILLIFLCYVHTVPRSPPYEALNNASISQSGSTVTVDCYADNKSDSCVVVYRAYSNSTLNVAYGNTVSMSVTLKTGNYSFAIFRRTSDSDIDNRP